MYQFAQNINKEDKPVLCAQILVWYFAKFWVLANTTQRKITKQVQKNVV